jgi:hypothetical protein
MPLKQAKPFPPVATGCRNERLDEAVYVCDRFGIMDHTKLIMGVLGCERWRSWCSPARPSALAELRLGLESSRDIADQLVVGELAKVLRGEAGCPRG